MRDSYWNPIMDIIILLGKCGIDWLYYNVSGDFIRGIFWHWDMLIKTN